MIRYHTVHTPPVTCDDGAASGYLIRQVRSALGLEHSTIGRPFRTVAPGIMDSAPQLRKATTMTTARTRPGRHGAVRNNSAGTPEL